MAAPARHTRSRPFAATAVAAVLLFVLSGCVKLNADFQVDAEENLTGAMEILVDPVALEDMGSPDPSQDLDDSVRDAQSDPEVPEGASIERVEDEDGYIGMRVAFDAVPASEFENGGGGLSDVGVEGIEVESTGGEITFSMANPLVAGMDSADPYGSASGMPSARSMFDEAVVAVTFPGSVVSADGAEVDGSTATWNLRDYDGDTLSATGEASSFPWVTVLIIAGVLVLLLIIAGVIVLLIVLRRRKAGRAGGPQQMMRAGAAGAPGAMGSAPGQYPGGPPPGPHAAGGGPGPYGQQGWPGGPGMPGGPGQGRPGGPGQSGHYSQQGPYGQQGQQGPYGQQGQQGQQGQPGPFGPGPHGPYGQQPGGATHPPSQGAPSGGDDVRRFAPPQSAQPQAGPGGDAQQLNPQANPRTNPPQDPPQDPPPDARPHS